MWVRQSCSKSRPKAGTMFSTSSTFCCTLIVAATHGQVAALAWRIKRWAEACGDSATVSSIGIPLKDRTSSAKRLDMPVPSAAMASMSARSALRGSKNSRLTR